MVKAGRARSYSEPIYGCTRLVYTVVRMRADAATRRFFIGEAEGEFVGGAAGAGERGFWRFDGTTGRLGADETAICVTRASWPKAEPTYPRRKLRGTPGPNSAANHSSGWRRGLRLFASRSPPIAKRRGAPTDAASPGLEKRRANAKKLRDLRAAQRGVGRRRSLEKARRRRRRAKNFRADGEF